MCFLKEYLYLSFERVCQPRLFLITEFYTDEKKWIEFQWMLILVKSTVLEYNDSTPLWSG